MDSYPKVVSQPSEGRMQTCDRLLDVSERLFAERGFRATSVRDITSEARCNIAAVNYYFGGKDNLYREMFRRRLRALREERIESIRRAVDQDGATPSLEGLLRAFITTFLRPLADESADRFYFQLISRELVDPHLSPDIFLAEMIEPVQNAWTHAVRAVMPDLDERSARLCFHALVGQLLHVVKVQKLLGSQGQKEQWSAQELVEHIVRFSVGGIRACLPASCP